MTELQLIKSEHFGEIDADIYSNGNDLFMTIEQLAGCLEYSARRGVEMLLDRNAYLKSPEFSVAHKLCATDGKRYNTRVFTEDGIYEVTMLSGQPKAKEFRAWIRGILKSLRTGKAKLIALPQDYPTALRALADVAEENLALAAENEVQKQIIADYEPIVQYPR